MAVLCVQATRKTHSLLQAGGTGGGGVESGLLGCTEFGNLTGEVETWSNKL